jgi:hypothetical protein
MSMRLLALSVIHVAVGDLDPRARAAHRESAQQFFADADAALNFWCSVAGVEVGDVVRAVRQRGASTHARTGSTPNGSQKRSQAFLARVVDVCSDQREAISGTVGRRVGS